MKIVLGILSSVHSAVLLFQHTLGNNNGQVQELSIAEINQMIFNK